MGARTGKKKKTKPRFPRIPPKAEIILKESYCVDATKSKEVPIPEIIMLANRQGFQFLGQYLLYLAERLEPRAQIAHPDDHQHFGTMFPEEPFNYQLSDRIELRIGMLSDENRKFVTKNYGISRKNRKHGSLVDRYSRLAQKAREGEGSWGGGGLSSSSET